MFKCSDMVVKIVYSDYFHNVNYFGETGKYASIWTSISSWELCAKKVLCVQTPATDWGA